MFIIVSLSLFHRKQSNLLIKLPRDGRQYTRRRIAPLSWKVAGLILQHEYFGRIQRQGVQNKNCWPRWWITWRSLVQNGFRCSSLCLWVYFIGNKVIYWSGYRGMGGSIRVEVKCDDKKSAVSSDSATVHQVVMTFYPIK